MLHWFPSSLFSIRRMKITLTHLPKIFGTSWFHPREKNNQFPALPLKFHEPFSGLEDLLEIDIVGPRTVSNSFTRGCAAVEVFSNYVVVLPRRPPDAPSAVIVLPPTSNRRAHVPQHILTAKGSILKAEVAKHTMKVVGIPKEHATIKHAQTFKLTELSHQKLRKVLWMNVRTYQPHWDQHVNIARLAHNTTYHASLNCLPS